MRTILIFIKNPELGKAKTRLAATLGDKKALAIYRLLLAHTRKQTAAVDAQRFLYYSRFIDQSDEWPSHDFQKHLQEGDDLGQRMKNAFGAAFTNEGGPVVIIGSDCAELTSDIIEEAFQQLTQHEIVIGPARDGGYYLLGLQQFVPELFEDIAWSTPDVFTQTLTRIPEGFSHYLLDTLSDIDTEADWLTYGKLLQE